MGLVGGLEHGWIMTFHSVGNVIIPTDELHHLSEGLVNHQPVGIVQDATLKIGDEKTIINSQGAVKLPMNAGDIL